MRNPLEVFIGYDTTQHEAFEVCKYSLLKRATIPVEVHPLILSSLKARNFYWRADDPLASTEFTYSRFLTPFLAAYDYAVFCDCDFLWLNDIGSMLPRSIDNEVEQKAVYVVMHDYSPNEPLKMDGKLQTVYPRKNWSSLMLFNMRHAALKKLTPIIVNSESAAYLHRLQWVAEHELGSLPGEWNWLEGWDNRPLIGTPSAVHFTRGGPWLGGEHAKRAYADLWLAERAAMLEEASAKAIL